MVNDFSEVSLLRGSTGILALSVPLHLYVPVLGGVPRSGTWEWESCASDLLVFTLRRNLYWSEKQNNQGEEIKQGSGFKRSLASAWSQREHENVSCTIEFAFSWCKDLGFYVLHCSVTGYGLQYREGVRGWGNFRHFKVRVQLPKCSPPEKISASPAVVTPTGVEEWPSEPVFTEEGSGAPNESATVVLHCL